MINIAPAEPSHTEAIAALAEEMDRFYGASEVEPLDIRVRQINEALFVEQPSAYVLLAWDEGQPVGFASYSFLWPAVGLTRSLFLKELYVVEAARGTGIGARLMRAVFQVAVKYGCSRVEWQTEITNDEARAFYAELGAQEVGGKICYRVENELVHRLIERKG